MKTTSRAAPEAKLRIGKILADAERAVRAVESLAVYDAEGTFVASARWATETDLSEQLPTILLILKTASCTWASCPRPMKPLRVAYAAALTDDGTTQGEVVGVLHVRFNTGPLARLARNREGLGISGETLIAIRDTDGAVRVLAPSEPGEEPGWEEVDLGGPPILSFWPWEVRRSAEPTISLTPRAKPVWAAVRYLPD